MTEQTDDIELPEDEQDAVEMVAETEGREWADQHRELIIAQAKLIGDL